MFLNIVLNINFFKICFFDMKSVFYSHYFDDIFELFSSIDPAEKIYDKTFPRSKIKTFVLSILKLTIF